MPKIAIDAGHGVTTAGKRSFDGSLLEYQFNREIAKRLNYHLQRHGFETLLTAPDDTDVDLWQRCVTANNWGADLFISLHGNAYGTNWNDANGWEICVLRLGGNAEKVAKLIYKQSIPFLGLTDRIAKNGGRIKTDNLAVLRDTNMSAVLIEHGFYTNQSDLALMKTVEFKEKCAVADAKGICEFYGVAWKEDVPAAPTDTTNYKALYEQAQAKLSEYDAKIAELNSKIALLSDTNTFQANSIAELNTKITTLRNAITIFKSF
jgi:N-acetylmuramoyl-L-alanine amidase